MAGTVGAWAFVFARGGSAGLPRKNLMELGGLPLIGRAIRVALSAECVERVIVSTDCEEIATVAQQFGAEVPWLRPNELATAESPEWDSWGHAVQSYQASDGSFPFETFVSLPATAPLRRRADILRSVALFQSGEFDLVLTVTRSDRHPAYNLLRELSDGSVQLLDRTRSPIHRRQDSPPVFEIVPVAYVTSPRHILRAEGVLDGRIGAVAVAPETAVDIDGGLDLDYADFLLRRSPEDYSESL